MSAALFRVIIRADGETRGRAYAGLLRNPATGRVIGIKRQPAGRGQALEYERRDAIALASELARYLPAGARVSVSRGHQ